MVEKLTANHFDKMYALMEASFPLDEYRTFAEQKDLLNIPEYQIYTLTDSDTDEIKAFIAVWDFQEIAFIEHFAVNPSCRNHGIGGKMLGEILVMAGKMVCLEVEPPEDEMTSRRVAFYKRNNFFLNEYDYVMPSISKGRRPVPLLIMTSGRPVSREEFNEIKQLLYTKVYRQP